MRYEILVVDDDAGFAERLCEALDDKTRNFYTANNAEDALKILETTDVHLTLLDEQLPDYSGIDLLGKIKEKYPNITNIVITATKSIPVVVRAIQLGAYHYIVKPFKIEELENIVKNALENIRLKNKIKTLEKENTSLNKPVFIGSSEKICEIKQQIETLKDHPYTSVLLSGETGTGKGSLAKYIHWQYSKDMTDFIHISCADIPANLLESELFGHVKGAFTDAKSEKKGLFELADGGTLFLDEIDGFPLELQKKLLYFLDNKKIRRVGGTKEISSDLRLIAATNTNLSELVNKGDFRKDLYYRLNVLHIELPPLRERKNDIADIANYFREYFNETFGKNIISFTKSAFDKLINYFWPGNIRELKNVIERAMIFCKTDDIQETDINLYEKEKINFTDFSFPPDKDKLITIKELETKYIKHALLLLDENRTKTAKILDISVPTLLSKIKN